MKSFKFCVWAVGTPSIVFCLHVVLSLWSPLAAKGCKFRPMLSPHSHCACSDGRFLGVPHLPRQWRKVFPRTSDSRFLTVELSQLVLTNLVCSRWRFQAPTFCMRDKCYNRMPLISTCKSTTGFLRYDTWGRDRSLISYTCYVLSFLSYIFFFKFCACVSMNI